METAVLAIDRATGATTDHTLADLAGLLRRSDSFVWVDIPEPTPESTGFLTTVVGLHPRAVEDCVARNHVPRLHSYADHLFLVLHRPERGTGGHVHYLELDQFLGPNFLVTVHGPRNPVVPLEALLTETGEVVKRLRAGRLRPTSPVALSYAIVSALTNSEERTLNQLASEVGTLEQRVMAQADDERPQAFLDELFSLRHALLTLRTMAAQSHEIYSRALLLRSDLSEPDQLLLADTKDQFRRLDRITSTQMSFLEGVTDFYRARTDTRMLIAAERLAVIAAITLPVTAISSVMGMNVIVNGQTHWGVLIVLVSLMTAMSVTLLVWARRQGWW